MSWGNVGTGVVAEQNTSRQRWSPSGISTIDLFAGLRTGHRLLGLRHATLAPPRAWLITKVRAESDGVDRSCHVYSCTV